MVTELYILELIWVFKQLKSDYNLLISTKSREYLYKIHFVEKKDCFLSVTVERLPRKSQRKFKTSSSDVTPKILKNWVIPSNSFIQNTLIVFI